MRFLPDVALRVTRNTLPMWQGVSRLVLIGRGRVRPAVVTSANLCLFPKFAYPDIALYGHEIEMYTVEQGEKRDKRQ